MADSVEIRTPLNSKSTIFCEMCGKECPKYRCPGCGRQTCSLLCVKQHKVEFSCNGVRCKTHFVSKDDYSDNTMLSDYKFLEDVDRVACTAIRDEKSKRKRWESQVMNFVKKARKSGVNVRLMPTGMSKRRENTSCFSSRKKQVMWRIKWIFPQAEAEYVDVRVFELEVVRNLLKKYIDPNEADPTIKQRLKPYFTAGVENVSVFLKSEYQPANKERYYLLDTSQTLQKCLAHKTIVEYPTLHVVLSEKASSYQHVGGSQTQQGTVSKVSAESSNTELKNQESDVDTSLNYPK